MIKKRRNRKAFNETQADIKNNEVVAEDNEVVAEDKMTIAKTKAAMTLTKLAHKIASLDKPLNKKQRSFVATKIVTIAELLESADDSEEEEEAEGINNAVKKIFQRKTDYNKLKTKKVKDVITKSGPEILNMKIQDFFEMVANM